MSRIKTPIFVTLGELAKIGVLNLGQSAKHQRKSNLAIFGKKWFHLRNQSVLKFFGDRPKLKRRFRPELKRLFSINHTEYGPEAKKRGQKEKKWGKLKNFIKGDIKI